MYRPLRPACLLAVLVPLLAFAQEAVPDEEGSIYAPNPAEKALFHSSWLLPRELLLGAFVQSRFIVPQLRLKWELTMYHANHDTLFFAVEGGVGYGVGLPKTYEDRTLAAPVQLFYEQVAMAGLGYRIDLNSRLYINVELLGGLLFFGGHQLGYREGSSVGTLEGRVKVGLRAGHAVYGLFLGDNTPFEHPPRSFFSVYTGGLLVGVFANWH